MTVEDLRKAIEGLPGNVELKGMNDQYDFLVEDVYYSQATDRLVISLDDGTP